MTESGRDREFTSFVGARATALLRTAYLLTGNPDTADALLTAVLASTYLDWRRVGRPETVEAHVRRAMVKGHQELGRSPAVPGDVVAEEEPDASTLVWSALDLLSARERAVVVLGVDGDLSDQEIAHLLGCSTRVVQTDAARGLGQLATAVPAGAAGSSLVSQVRATLQARAGDVRPRADLVDDVRTVALRLGRSRRARRRKFVAAACVVLAGLAVLSAVTTADPPAAHGPTTPSRPTPSVEPLPDEVLRMALENQALLAFDATILDASSGSLEVTVEVDPGTGASLGRRITALARAETGYVFRTAPDPASAEPRAELAFIGHNGVRTELGRVGADQDGFAVSPDGLSVVHVVTGPVEGENALAAGESELVVQTLSGDVVNRITVPGPVRPLYVDADQVWYSPLGDPGGPPYVWDRADGTLTRLAAPATVTALDVRGTRLLVEDTETGCLSLLDAADPRAPRALWKTCRAARLARFDPTSSSVAVAPLDRLGGLTVLDANDGRPRYGAEAPAGAPVELAWTAAGTRVLTADASDGTHAYASVSAVPGAGQVPVLLVGTYEVPEGPVVLGLELPLPASSL